MPNVAPHPCIGCGRVVAYRRKRQSGGRARVRHKCTHGTWCIFGEPNGAIGWLWPKCKECLPAARSRYVVADHAR